MTHIMALDWQVAMILPDGEECDAGFGSLVKALPDGEE